jgi:bifunctional DNase/RNase
VRTIDARPSDGVAIGLRAEAPLYAAESVLAAANETPTGDAPPETPAGPDLDVDDL